MDSTGGTPYFIVYTLKRETADEVAGRLKVKGVALGHTSSMLTNVALAYVLLEGTFQIGQPLTSEPLVSNEKHT